MDLSPEVEEGSASGTPNNDGLQEAHKRPGALRTLRSTVVQGIARMPLEPPNAPFSTGLKALSTGQ